MKCANCRKEIPGKLILCCCCGSFCSKGCMCKYHERNKRRELLIKRGVKK